MISTNYRIEALDILLDRECLPERYYPLIEYKHELVSGLLKSGCKRKNDIQNLSDEQLIDLGLNDGRLINMFRRFLGIYDPNPQKFKEIDKVAVNDDEKASYSELYCLPGVKAIRASLYYLSGYRSLNDFTSSTVDEVIGKTGLAIKKNKLSCIVPLPKEIRTHIAVSKAFLL